MKWAIKANIPINENDAIARGISSLVTASSISWPMPGHEKIDSVNTEPSMIVIMVKIKDVTTGYRAVLAACLSLILFWLRPFALAVRI